MGKKAKGFVLEINGSTVSLNKALADLNKESRAIQKELQAVERLLKLDPKNTELLAQKQHLLSRQVELTEKKVTALKSAKEKADRDMANGTEVNAEEYRKLQREIVETEQEIKDMSETFSTGKVALGNFVADGLSAVAEKAMEAVEASREYREDMGKLTTAFEASGKSADDAKTIYDEFYGILGESDRSVEAVNHLAQLCKTEEELAAWSNICAGVTATFGDSLPIEGLTEAANETTKMGRVTGVLADALNWIGMSEDDFNESLAACTNEQERSALITQTLSEAYRDTGAAYRETNADIIAGREATASYEEAMAELGAEVEPILNEITSKVSELIGWILDNKDVVIAALVGIGAGFLVFQVATMIMGVVQAFKALQTATQGMTMAQAALNLVMSLNPIGLITVAVAGLLASFVLLWNKCEGFRNFWIGLCEKIKTVFFSVISFIKDNWKQLATFLINPIAGVIALLYKLNPQFREWVDNLITEIKEGFVKMIEVGKNIVTGLWEGIAGSMKWLVGKIKEWCGNILDNIKDFFGIHSPSQYTKEFGKYLVQGLAEGITEDMSAEEALKKKCENLLAKMNEYLSAAQADADIAAKEYALWEMQNPAATEEEKLWKQEEMLNKQLAAQEEQVQLTNDALWEMKQQTGENSEESKKLTLQLLEEQIAYENLTASMRETIKAKAALESKRLEDYNAYLNQNYTVLRNAGYSDTMIDEAARQKSGYTGKTQVQVINNNYGVDEGSAYQVSEKTRRTMNDLSMQGVL